MKLKTLFLMGQNLNVETGVPQGTVLGPPLFLIHTNDTEYKITSSICLIADDVPFTDQFILKVTPLLHK